MGICCGKGHEVVGRIWKALVSCAKGSRTSWAGGSALHNHWMMETPRLFYLHYASIEEPLSFARKVAEAYQVLR